MFLFPVSAEMKAIRLTGGLDRCSGKVEIHRNGSWGTVCDHCWNMDMASRVCSMLQCGTKAEKAAQFEPPLTHNNGSLWLYFCDPDAKSLWQCREYVNIPHLCKDSKASGVICNGEPCSFFILTMWVQLALQETVAENFPFIPFCSDAYKKFELVVYLFKKSSAKSLHEITS